MKNIRVALADDHKLVLEGFKVLIGTFTGITIDFSVTHGNDLLDQLNKRNPHPDLILLDLDMPGPGGNRTLQELRAQHKRIKILIVTMHTNPTHVVSAFYHGANGYVPKSVSAAQLEEAIKATVTHGFYLCPSIAAMLPKEEVHRLAGTKPKLREMEETYDTLSPVDQLIVEWISQGLTSAQMAEELNISARTIEGRRRRILQRTGCINGAELVIKAREKGWI